MTRLRVGASTDTGQVRANNQDAILVAELVFAVADGMGGHAAGEIASRVAVESLQNSTVTSLEQLVAAVGNANRAVRERAENDSELRGMGTTMCVVALVPGDDERGVDGDCIMVANVGDSRVYQFHDGLMKQLTDDHTLVEDLVRGGCLSPDEARTHPRRNIVTRVLGTEPEVKVDAWQVVPQRGDRYLLCSDGLFNEVDDDRIARVLRRRDDPEDAARELVALANQGGGCDNISVVVIDIVDDVRVGPVAAVPGANNEASPAPRTTGVPVTPPAPVVGVEPRVRDDSERVRSTAAWSGGGGDRRPMSGRVTWRSWLFVVSVLVVLGGAAATVTWYAVGTYHVGIDGGEVAIFRGPPGGVLWVEPSVVERTGVVLPTVPPSLRDAVMSGKEERTLSDARDYVAKLKSQADAEELMTTTVSTHTAAATTSTNAEPRRTTTE